MSEAPNVVLANDIAWGGWGWAVCTQDGPAWVGWVKLAGGWEWWKLRRYLDEVLELELLEARALRHASSPPVLVLGERAPTVYRGRGNQAATGFGLGRILGPLMCWAARPHQSELAYPWDVPVKTWRSWWGLTGNREAVKRRAIALVIREGWGAHLEPYAGDARGDVAEAILQGVGAARRPELWPKGPQRGIDFDLPSCSA